MAFHSVANSAHRVIHLTSTFLYVLGSVVSLKSHVLRPLDDRLHILYDMRCHSLGRKGCFPIPDRSEGRDSAVELSLHMMEISTCVIHILP